MVCESEADESRDSTDINPSINTSTASSRYRDKEGKRRETEKALGLDSGWSDKNSDDGANPALNRQSSEHKTTATSASPSTLPPPGVNLLTKPSSSATSTPGLAAKLEQLSNSLNGLNKLSQEMVEPSVARDLGPSLRSTPAPLTIDNSAAMSSR